MHTSGQRTRRKRHRSTSPQQQQQRRSDGAEPSTPPVRARPPAGSPALHGASPFLSPPDMASPGGLHYRGSVGGVYADSAAPGVRAARVQVLQDVLRRTSLAELRDREIVEWLGETEGWLVKGEAAFSFAPSSSPLSLSSKDGGGGGGVGPAQVNHHFPGAAELRLLVLGVLHTMPWWRVVESVETPAPSAASASAASSRLKPSGAGPARMEAKPPTSSSAAAAKAVTRWHERIQIGFERVCLVLIEQSQHTVPGVLEVVMRPFHLRPPVRDGARRAIPTDSFLRIINAIATIYSAAYVLELFKSCLDTLLPKRRWQDRRHHLAATAMLLHLALEASIPSFQAGTGNSHSLERANALMAAAATVQERALTAASENRLGDTKSMAGDGDRTDERSDSNGGQSDSHSADAVVSASHAAAQGGSTSIASLALPESTSTHGETSRLPQTPLPPRMNDVDAFDGDSSSTGSGTLSSHTSTTGPEGRVGAAGPSTTSTGPTAAVSKSAFLAMSCRDNSLTGTPRSMLIQMPSQWKAAGVTAAAAGSSTLNAHGSASPQNRMLACRTDIVRFLLQRLLEMELTLEGDAADDASLGLPGPAGAAADELSESVSVASASFSGRASEPWWAPRRAGCLSIVAHRVHGLGSPAPVAARPAALAAHACAQQVCSALRNRQAISLAAQPFLYILVDCTQLTFLTLAEDLRRRHAQGIAGSAEWWREVVLLFLHAVRRVERPKCLLFLAPSLAMLGDEDQPLDLLHKLISLVTKGYMPSLGSFLTAAGGGGAGMGAERGGGSYTQASLSPATAAASSQMRATPPTIGGGATAATPMRMRMVSRHPSSSLATQPVPMQERLRAAMYIFPLFHFMQPKIGGVNGIRRRLLRWVAQEARRGGGGGGSATLTPAAASTSPSPSAASSVSGVSHALMRGGHVRTGSVGSISASTATAAAAGRPTGSRVNATASRLVDIVFAQCAAISAVTSSSSQDEVTAAAVAALDPFTPPLEEHPPGETSANGARRSGGAGAIDEALVPLLDRFVLMDREDEEATEQGDNNALRECSDMAEAHGGAAGKEKLLDLRKMEEEGILRPNLMEGCMWTAMLDAWC